MCTCMSNQFAANFVKFYKEIKKLYAFEVSIISLMDAAVFVSLSNNLESV